MAASPSTALANRFRLRSIGAVLLALAVSSVAAAAMAAPTNAELTVRAECHERVGAGRVRCEVEVELTSGKLRWAELRVLRVTAPLTVLRARTEPTRRLGPARLRLEPALAAEGPGNGTVELEVRTVVCPADGECVPLRRAVTLAVVAR